MKKLIVVRAGNTPWQEQDRIQGTVPLPLTEASRKDLINVAEDLSKEECDCLYCSGNESSGLTAEFLSGLCRWKIKKISQLREMDYGIWQGLRIEDIKNRYCSAYKQWRKDPANVCPPDGEPLQQVHQRVGDGLRRIVKKNRSDTVVIVAARVVSAVIECILKDIPLNQLWSVTDQDRPIRVYDFTDREMCDVLARLTSESAAPDLATQIEEKPKVEV